ncbi:MAG: STAS domain-containing protein [Thermodesulfobacteriota bacterium]|nr:STAS domain-containing protein [Thermodesulfobacteriota bacterium]
MFECTVADGSGLKWIAFKGRIDAMSSAAIQKEFDGLTMAGERMIVADLSGVNYISSAGLRVFLVVQRKLRRVGGEIILFNLDKHVMDVFNVSGFDQLFRIFSTGDEVMSSLRGGTTRHEVVSTEIGGIAIEYAGFEAGKGSVFAVGSQEKLAGAGYCEEDVVTVRPSDVQFGTGLATLGEEYEDFKGLFGESMIIDRNLFFYPAIKHPAVDFMLDAEGDHGLAYKFLHGSGFDGPYRYILSFEGREGFVELSSLIKVFFEVSDANLLGIVMVAESKGIWGMHLKRVPIWELRPDNGKDIFDPENFTDWINFPIEPADVNHVVAGTGIAVRDKGIERPEIQGLFSEDNSFHIHAGMFEKGPIGRQLDMFEDELTRILTELNVYKIQHILGQSWFKSGMAGIVELEG